MVSCCCFTTVCLGTPQPDVRPPGPDTVGVGRWAASSGPGGLPVKTSIGYMTARPAEDPHLWAQTLMDELEPLGFPLSYQSRMAAEPYNSRRYMSCEADYFDTVK